MISAARRKLSRIAEKAKAVKRLRDTGILDLGNLGVTLETAKNAGVYGGQAALAIQGGRKYPTLPAVVDERGTSTYKQIDDESTAFGPRADTDSASARARSWAFSAATTAASSSRWPRAARSVPGSC